MTRAPASQNKPVAWRRRRKGTQGNAGWIMCPLKPEADKEFDLQPLYPPTAIQDAFEAGFKAAGGAIVPDGARDTVELALTRDEIDVLAKAAHTVRLRATDAGVSAALTSFLEKVSIFRRKG